MRMLRILLLTCLGVDGRRVAQWIARSAAVGALMAAPAAAAGTTAPFLSPVFSDRMVLQREKPNAFWGWTEPDSEVRVTIAGRTARARAAADGRWQAWVEPPAAGGPYVVTIEGPERRELRDVLVGDVWLCGGQSNMAMALRATRDGPAVAATASDPHVRFRQVPTRTAYSEIRDAGGRWTVCTPEAAAGFSAVAFYFARELRRELQVPIGLIQVAVGGSPAESWMSERALREVGEFAPQLDALERLRVADARPTGSFLMHWLEDHDGPAEAAGWARPEFDDSTWTRVTVPGGFRELGAAEHPAVVWFRRELNLPDPLPPGEARVRLGAVEKMDTVWLNGRWVGASSWVENPRSYAVPAGVLKPGRNVIAIRVFKTKPDGGFLGGAEALRLELPGGAVVPLAGEWNAQVSVDARPPFPLPLDGENYPTMPTALQQGMLAPLAPLAVTGAIWYQGEANTARAAQYRRLLPALIADWRELFRQGEFPFLIAGLPAFMATRSEAGTTDGWAELREAQMMAAQTVRHVAVAVTIDTGDAKDIHPIDKAPVGERLARWALARHYGKPLPASGPVLRAVDRRPGALVLHFDHADDGLSARGDGPLFAIAGADRRWVWARVKIAGDTVTLTADSIAEPRYVRHAWQANPGGALFNGIGLPAAPFRTD